MPCQPCRDPGRPCSQRCDQAHVARIRPLLSFLLFLLLLVFFFHDHLILLGHTRRCIPTSPHGMQTPLVAHRGSLQSHPSSSHLTSPRLSLFHLASNPLPHFTSHKSRPLRHTQYSAHCRINLLIIPLTVLVHVVVVTKPINPNLLLSSLHVLPDTVHLVPSPSRSSSLLQKQGYRPLAAFVQRYSVKKKKSFHNSSSKKNKTQSPICPFS